MFGKNLPPGSEDRKWKCVIYSLYRMATLKIRSRSQKSDQLFLPLFKFDQNPSIGSEDNTQKRSYLEADEIRTKTICPTCLRLWGH